MKIKFFNFSVIFFLKICTTFIYILQTNNVIQSRRLNHNKYNIIYEKNLFPYFKSTRWQNRVRHSVVHEERRYITYANINTFL